MGYYDTMQVCLKGHSITDRYNGYPQHREDHCHACGAGTIHTCNSCSAPIRGDYMVDGIIAAGATPVPNHCHKCGKPYPWARKMKIVAMLKAAISPLRWLVEVIAGLFKR